MLIKADVTSQEEKLSYIFKHIEQYSVATKTFCLQIHFSHRFFFEQFTGGNKLQASSVFSIDFVIFSKYMRVDSIYNIEELCKIRQNLIALLHKMTDRAQF